MPNRVEIIEERLKKFDHWSLKQGAHPGTTFYNFSGGMESAAMLVVDRDRIQSLGAHVIFADTGKQFPEMAQSIAEIEAALSLKIETVPRRITFDEFLFERGGMLRKGMTDCSRRMKRTNLSRYMKLFEKPYEANLGYNSEETDRAADFVALNEREWIHWRFPLVEANVCREETWDICGRAGFKTLIAMYTKMGRFDCFLCPNQKPSQAVKVAKFYPNLAAEWIAIEEKKGHPILPTPFRILVNEQAEFDWKGEISCSCFGGSESFVDEVTE